MEVHIKVRIIAVDRLNDGIVIRFDDAICAYYSSELLHAMAPQAEALDEDAPL